MDQIGWNWGDLLSTPVCQDYTSTPSSKVTTSFVNTAVLTMSGDSPSDLCTPGGPTSAVCSMTSSRSAGTWRTAQLSSESVESWLPLWDAPWPDEEQRHCTAGVASACVAFSCSSMRSHFTSSSRITSSRSLADRLLRQMIERKRPMVQRSRQSKCWTSSFIGTRQRVATIGGMWLGDHYGFVQNGLPQIPWL